MKGFYLNKYLISGFVKALPMYKKLYVFCLISFWGAFQLVAGTNTPVEQVSIATDRDVYVAGDWVYFSIKIQDAGYHVSDFAYLTVSNSKQRQVFTGCLKITNNIASGSFYLADTLTTGIYQLVSYTNHLRNYGTDVYAVKNILVANRFDAELKKFSEELVSKSTDTLFQTEPAKNNPDLCVQLNKEVFSQREPISLDIRLPDAIANALVSVSVRKAAPVNLQGRSTYRKYPNSEICCKYLPERSGVILQGYVHDVNNNSAANKTVFLSCEDSLANLQFVHTKENGEFRFFLNPYYFGKKVVVKLGGEDKSPIQIESKYFEGIVGTLPVQIHGDLESYLETDQKYLGIQWSFNEKYRQEYLEKNTAKSWRPEVYSREGIVVRPADYVYLNDFKEIAHELLMYYKIREKKDDFVGSIIDINQKEFSIPYIFLDGILLEHVRQIIPLDSKKIRSILTIPNARFLGDLNLPGILDIATNNAEIEKVQWRYSVAMLDVEHPMPNSTYKVPEMDKIPRQIPVYLPLLYWNPALLINSGKTSTATIFTSDCTGTFEVIINGFSSDGKEIEFRKLFEVTSLK
jgi:hypothetical protein